MNDEGGNEEFVHIDLADPETRDAIVLIANSFKEELKMRGVKFPVDYWNDPVQLEKLVSELRSLFGHNEPVVLLPYTEA